MRVFFNMVLGTAFYQVIIIFKEWILFGKMGLGENKPAQSKGIWWSSSSLWTCEILCTFLGSFESCSSTLLAGRHPASLVDFSVEEVYLAAEWFSAFYANLSPWCGFLHRISGEWRPVPSSLQCWLLEARQNKEEPGFSTHWFCHLAINCFDFIFYHLQNMVSTSGMSVKVRVCVCVCV